MNSTDLTPVFAPSVIVKTRSTRLFGCSMISGLTRHVIAAGMAIDFGDALRVGLHHRARQRAARLGLHFRRKLLVLDLLVALEGDAADHRVFDHGHQQTAAGLADPHVLEQAGLDQRLQAVIDLRLIQASAGTRLEIGADGLDLDAPVALDLDRSHGLGGSRRRHNTPASVAATGTANMIRAANKPPRTRIPKFMRNAPLSFQCRTAPHEPADSHLLHCL